MVEEIEKLAEGVKQIAGQKKKYTIIWQQLMQKFPEIGDNLPKVWGLFKMMFVEYMNDLESGIDNKWPQDWWEVLAKMKFLIEERYHNMEPYYYIVRNKVMEEISRCALLDFDLRKKKNLHAILNEERVTAILKQNESALYTSQSLTDPQLQKHPDIDAYNLILAIRRHPEVYHKVDKITKAAAWQQISQEMNSTVTSCRLAFQWAAKSYRHYVARDPATRCRINHRYFKHIAEIYRTIKSPGKINIKTPFELNQSIADSMETSEIIFPERFIVDINMSNCKPALVMKNWAYGVSNLPCSWGILSTKLTDLFEKYQQYVKNN